MKKNKIQFTFLDSNKILHTFDSNEELEFYHWCEEALKYKLLSSYSYHFKSYELISKKTYIEDVQLKTKVKTIEKTLLQSHDYTPDFCVNFTDLFFKYFLKTSFNNIKYVSNNPFIIDIKGSFQRNGGDRSFSINRKLMYDIYNIYVFKIIPEELFKETWVPENCRYSLKKKQLKVKYSTCKTIQDIIKK